MEIHLADISPAQCQQWLQHAIAPRPICLASTINAAWEVNLSPFSYFNLFSSTPPIVVFSPVRRMRDGSTKHTLNNLMEVPELVINIVDESIVQQVSLASCEYPEGVNEFIKAGFTEEKASLVKAPMVKESKIKMECRVQEIKALGTGPGAGNLVICEVLRLHVDERILNAAHTMIDQQKIHHVARLGSNWYSRVDSASLFEVEKPNTQLGIGIDALPDHIRLSKILSGNELAQLANLSELPAVDPAYEDRRLRNIFQYFAIDPAEMEKELHQYARELLQEHKVREAWQVLLSTQ